MKEGWSIRDSISWAVLFTGDEDACRKALPAFQRSGLQAVMVFTAPFTLPLPPKLKPGHAKAA